MKQKHYRVTLYPNSTILCNDLAILSCISNGANGSRLSLKDIESYFKAEALKWPGINKDCQCTVEGHLLTVDKKIDSAGVCLLAIEEVELFTIENKEQE